MKKLKIVKVSKELKQGSIRQTDRKKTHFEVWCWSDSNQDWDWCPVLYHFIIIVSILIINGLISLAVCFYLRNTHRLCCLTSSENQQTVFFLFF